MGGAFYSDNPNLVDTRIPGLKQLGSNVTVVNCNRLCPARYTVVGTSPSDAGCPNLQMEYYFHVTGNVSVNQLTLIEGITYNALQSIAKNTVCALCDFLCLMFHRMCFQYAGAVTASIMESGPGWMNVQTVSTNIPSTVLYLAPFQTIVVGGTLPLYASITAQTALFSVCNLSQLSTPIFLADQSQGYNTGTTLLGLLQCGR